MPVPTVLIVEDDPVVCESLELALLILPGIEVRCVSSAEQARAALASGDPIHALITDVHLPGEDGLSLVRALRSMPGRATLPVIVTTSSREPSLRQRAAAIGVNAFFEKPWSGPLLRNTVQSLVHAT